MANNTNSTSFGKKVAAAGLITVGALGALETYNSSQTGETCDVPIVGTVSHTVDMVNNAGGDAVDAKIVDHNGVLIDKLSRSIQEDGSTTVFEGDVLEGTRVPDKVVCDAIIELAQKNNQDQ